MITEIDNQFLHACTRDHLAIVSFRDNVYELITSIEQSQVLMDFIREAGHDHGTKGLLLMNQSSCLGEEEYDRFIRSIMKEKPTEQSEDMPDFLQKNTRFRQINILNRFIHFLAEYQKLVIVGIDCTLVTPFMGATMVADLRLASPRAVFSLAHKKYGLHPSGAIPYFLTHYLGHSKSIEVQLSDRLSAEEAFRLGLVSQILPEDRFVENCIRYVQPYLSYCRSTLQMTKRLNNFKHRWLDEYFDHETVLMNL
jgi:enoyl-CoA hydratase/carnithine racemase